MLASLFRLPGSSPAPAGASALALALVGACGCRLLDRFLGRRLALDGPEPRLSEAAHRLRPLTEEDLSKMTPEELDLEIAALEEEARLRGLGADALAGGRPGLAGGEDEEGDEGEDGGGADEGRAGELMRGAGARPAEGSIEARAARAAASPARPAAQLAAGAAAVPARRKSALDRRGAIHRHAGALGEGSPREAAAPPAAAAGAAAGGAAAGALPPTVTLESVLDLQRRFRESAFVQPYLRHRAEKAAKARAANSN